MNPQPIDMHQIDPHDIDKFRRRILAAGAAAGFSLAVQSVFGRAPMAGTQVPGAHCMKLGAFEVTAISDGYVESAPKLITGDPDLVPALLDAAHLPNGPIRVSVNAFLVNTGGKLVLIDSGAAKLMGPTMGRLMQGFAAAGIDPAQVDDILLTHMHGDHLGGVATPEGKALFPNATLRVARPDYDFWTSDENLAKEKERKDRFIAAKRAVAAYGDRVMPFAPSEEIVPGIRSIAAFGHIPGHTCYMIQSGNARMIATGDTLHIAAVQFSRPEVTIASDSDQNRARATRRAILDMAARENLIIAAAHLPFPGLGYVRKKGASYAFDPLPWQMF